MKSHLNTWMLAVLAVLLLWAVPGAAAEDIIKLKTGEEVRGDIVRELEGSVWLEESFGTVKRERFFSASQIEEIVRDATDAAGGDAASNKPSGSNIPRGTVISLEGTVGIQMTAQKLRDLIPVLEEEIGSDGSGIVVFKVNSGGGLLLEIQRLSDVIQEEYKPRFQVVAWIESAISAAAMTAHCIEQIYFLPEGNYGGCTGWSGQLTAVKGLDYEKVIYQMEKISARGGYDPRIMRAMQGHWEESHDGGAWLLSCTVDETGKVDWFDSADQGEILVNDFGDVLTFNSDVAEQVRFSKGTVRTLDELTRAMGYQEIEWIGKPYEGRIYPVGRAEADMLKFREKVTRDEERFNEIMTKWNINLEAAAGVPADDRGTFVGRARRYLAQVRQMVRENGNFALLNFNMLPDEFDRWYEEQLEMMRELLRDP